MKIVNWLQLYFLEGKLSWSYSSMIKGHIAPKNNLTQTYPTGKNFHWNLNFANVKFAKFKFRLVLCLKESLDDSLYTR